VSDPCRGPGAGWCTHCQEWHHTGVSFNSRMTDGTVHRWHWAAGSDVLVQALCQPPAPRR